MKIFHHFGQNLWECMPLALYICKEIPWEKLRLEEVSKTTHYLIIFIVKFLKLFS